MTSTEELKAKYELEYTQAPSIRPPDSVFYWDDSKPTGATGWVVLDRVINRVAGGGIFMHANATEQEVADIARNMSRKFTVTNPQIGGAKAGIRFDHRDPRAKEVLRRFIKDHEALLRNVWVTAGDLNTDDVFIETVIQDDLGLPTMQFVLGKSFSRATGQPNRSGNVSRVIRHPASPFFPLIEGAVGCGVAESVRAAIRLTRPEGVGKYRVLIQGFGAVGSSLAYYLQTRNIAIVVGIADKDGFIHHPNGIDIVEILAARQRRLVELQAKKAAEKSLVETQKNCLCNLNEAELKRWNAVNRTEPFSTPGNMSFLERFLSCEKAEVFSPCALRYQITLSITDILIKHTWSDKNARYLVCGANNPYGTINAEGFLEEDRSGMVEQALRKAEVCIVPDWVANSGTAQLFHRSVSVEFNLKEAEAAERVLDAVTAPMVTYIEKALQTVNGLKEFLPYGCEELAKMKLANPDQLFSRTKIIQNPGKSPYCLPPAATALPSLEERIRLCSRDGMNIIDAEELKTLLTNCNNPVAYDGFEPSGRMHIAQGIIKKQLVDRLTAAGFTFIFYIADWFAFMNHKLGGDLEKIRTVGRYFIEVWKALGMDTSRVRFLWASEEMKKRADDYWDNVLATARRFPLSRVSNKLATIMGRTEQDSLTISQALYPCMQVADATFLGVDLCCMGEDQKEVTLMARENAEKTNKPKPIFLGHPLLPGLQKGCKMSKSKPESAIFMEDSVEEVKRKISSIYCPHDDLDNNPCLAFYQHLIFPERKDKKVPLSLHRSAGVPLEFDDFEALKKSFANNEISAEDLKADLASFINQVLEPVRHHFATDPIAKELYEKVSIIYDS